PAWAKFPMIVLVTTIVWVAVTFLTQAESKTVLQHFYKKIQPGGPGWQKIVLEARQENIELENTKAGWSVPSGILAMLVGCALIYSIMFATGYIIYGNYLNGLLLIGAALIFALLLMKLWKKIKVTIL
ncbi:MAG: Na+:solute symporter, partial [Winogradskyella sp.]|nr:Na+:solute symporter [Winogradskyella sp.]